MSSQAKAQTVVKQGSFKINAIAAQIETPLRTGKGLKKESKLDVK